MENRNSKKERKKGNKKYRWTNGQSDKEESKKEKDKTNKKSQNLLYTYCTCIHTFMSLKPDRKTNRLKS